MRLKEDSSSWRGMGLKAKAAPIPERPKYKAKKDTKRWCLGKVGRDHDYEVRQPQGGMFSRGSYSEGRVRMPVCKRCGRQDYDRIEYKQKDGSFSKRSWYA